MEADDSVKTKKFMLPTKKGKTVLDNCVAITMESFYFKNTKSLKLQFVIFF